MEFVRKKHVYVFVKLFGCIICIGLYLEMVNPIVVTKNILIYSPPVNCILTLFNFYNVFIQYSPAF